MFVEMLGIYLIFKISNGTNVELLIFKLFKLWWWTWILVDSVDLVQIGL